MNVFEKAKSLANEKRAIEKKESDEANRRAAIEKREDERKRSRFLKTVLELNGRYGFTVTKSEHDGPFGTVAVLKHKGEYIGTFCIQNRSYQWRGSDESPEQTCYSENLVLRHTLNGGACAVEVEIDYNRPIHKAIPEFMESLAHYLSRYF